MRYFIIILTIPYLFSIAHATDSIHYFDLQNRPADEVIPLLQPLLQDNEAISGTGFQLFIKTSTQRKQEIQNLISAIDKAAKTFRITVTNDEYIVEEQNNIQGSITVNTGDANVSVGTEANDSTGVTVSIDTREVEDKSDKTQFIQVQEGKPAFISRESLHIVPIHAYIQRPNGNFLIEHNHLSPSQQDGFYVIARSAGPESAAITIQSSSSNRRTYQGYGRDQTYVDTSLRIPFGKWIEIGGNTDTSKTETKGILYKTKKNQERYRKVFLKIELSDI